MKTVAHTRGSESGEDESMMSENLTKMVNAQRQLIEGLEKLLVSYRLGTRAHDTLLDKIHAARTRIQKLTAEERMNDGQHDN